MLSLIGSRWRALASCTMVASLLAGLAGCSQDSPATLPSATPSASDTPSGSASAAGATPRPLRNDLAKLPLKRAVGAGPLTVNIEYNTTLPLENWKPSVSKPIELGLTAVNKKKSGQKIYLTKVSADITAYDESGPVDDSRTLTDTSGINPGFIVTFPNTYNQRFLLPATSEVATRVAIDFTYEFVLQVNKDSDGRNFSKQVATDTILVPLDLE